jgi:hypothetical protein
LYKSLLISHTYKIISRATNVVKYQPWQISVAGFWLSAMANFVKDGDTTVPYSDVADWRHGMSAGMAGVWLSAIDNTASR